MNEANPGTPGTLIDSHVGILPDASLGHIHDNTARLTSYSCTRRLEQLVERPESEWEDPDLTKLAA